MSAWEGFKYVPVDVIAQRVAIRNIRRARHNMERFFADRGFYGFFERMRALRRNSRLNAIQKRNQFQRILDDYSATVTARAAPSGTAEATHSLEAGPLGVSGEGGTDVESASRIQRTSGHADGTAGGVPELAETDSGERFVVGDPIVDAEGRRVGMIIGGTMADDTFKCRCTPGNPCAWHG
jgi:hypothetical protein